MVESEYNVTRVVDLRWNKLNGRYEGRLIMEQLNKFDQMCIFIEQTYANAYNAFECGATKEAVLNEIEEAFECAQEVIKEGRLQG
jgi:hypothetical protein